MNKNIKLNKSGIKTTTISMFVIMFVYGLMLLMIGYTNPGLQQITGLKGGKTIFLALPQSIGLIIGTLGLKWLLSKFNIRTILSVGFGFAFASIIILSQLDKITGSTGVNPSSSAQKTALIVYLIISFIMGLGISPSSPIASTYMSTVYKGHKKSALLSLSNAVYGIGGGIIPLALASFIYNQSNNNNVAKFDTLRYFYYIAMGFLALALLLSLLTNYKHSKERLSGEIKNTNNSNSENKIENQKDINLTKRHFWTAVILIISMFAFYMISETISNYSFVHFVNPDGGDDKSRTITATMAFGLFVLIQGIWRAVSGLTLVKWIKLKYFVISSFVLVVTAFAILATGIIKDNPNLSYLVAILIGLGLGNIWPMMFSYGTGVNEEKAPLIGVCINIISMAMIPIVQVASALVINVNNGLTIMAIVGITTAVLASITIWYLSFYLKMKKMEHQNDSEESAFGKWLKSRSSKKTSKKA